MIAVKFFSKEKINDDISKTINNVFEFMQNKLLLNNIKILKSSFDSEIISGQNDNISSDDLKIELVIKKTIIINKTDFANKHSLDKKISEIKNFCEQAKQIEDVKYIPLTIRT